MCAVASSRLASTGTNESLRRARETMPRGIGLRATRPPIRATGAAPATRRLRCDIPGLHSAARSAATDC